jgi:hypothetical protein
VWQPKNFDRQPSYRHYFLDDDQIFSITTKRGCHMFLESFRQEVLKTCGIPLFLAIKKPQLPYENL